jgi:serine/threonine-protein kinase
VQGQHVDGRSDQFSLAVIAYEMLTGEKPYTGEHLTTVVYKIVAEEPLPPHRINPGLAGAIEGALRKAMAKKPDARYKSCQDFVETLEKAGTATKGWKPLARGGLLQEPTMADVPAIAATVPTKMLAPPRRPRRADATATGTTTTPTGKRKTGFLTFLLAILVAAGLLALIGWQAAPYVLPWLQPPANEHRATVPKEQVPPPTAQPEVVPPVSAPATSTPASSPPAALSPEDAKPSPAGPLTEEARPVEPVRPPAGAPASVAHTGPAQDVTVTTSPGGAKASLDGNTAAACSTPCTLKAASGKHTLMVMLPGYEMESREFLMGNSATELAPLVLRAAGGTLMLTSDPKGASVSINGRRIDMVTPAQIPLAPGTYQITVEKDGRQSTAQVEIRNGINYSKLVLQ